MGFEHSLRRRANAYAVDVTQSSSESGAEGLARTTAQIPSCALDQRGLERQGERLTRLAGAVTQITRERQRLIVEFARNFDRALLEEAIAVERECCPFFAFSFEPCARRMEVAVEDTSMLAALDAIEHGLSAPATAS
jgi:hypothetical protein